MGGYIVHVRLKCKASEGVSYALPASAKPSRKAREAIRSAKTKGLAHSIWLIKRAGSLGYAHAVQCLPPLYTVRVARKFRSWKYLPKAYVFSLVSTAYLHLSHARLSRALVHALYMSIAA